MDSIPTAVLFHFNGVIVDDYPLQKEAWNQISLQVRDRPVTDAEMIKQIRGVPSKDTITLFVAGVKNIIVIGRAEQQKAFGHLESVVKTAHNFSELKSTDFFDYKIS